MLKATPKHRSNSKNTTKSTSKRNPRLLSSKKKHHQKVSSRSVSSQPKLLSPAPLSSTSFHFSRHPKLFKSSHLAFSSSSNPSTVLNSNIQVDAQPINPANGFTMNFQSNQPLQNNHNFMQFGIDMSKIQVTPAPTSIEPSSSLLSTSQTTTTAMHLKVGPADNEAVHMTSPKQTESQNETITPKETTTDVVKATESTPQTTSNKPLVFVEDDIDVLLNGVDPNHLNLMQFWSKNTKERTAKFKEIILKGEIDYENFAAILDNTFGRPSQDWTKANWTNDPAIGNNIRVKPFTFPRHLKLDCNTQRDLDHSDPQQVFNIELQYNTRAYHDVGVYLHLPKSDQRHIFTEAMLHGFGSHGLAWQILRTILKQDNVDLFPPGSNFHTPSQHKGPNTLANITKENIDEYDLSKVNIYHLIPKGKHLDYFFGPLKSMDTGFTKVINFQFKNRQNYQYVPNPAPLSIEQFFAVSEKHARFVHEPQSVFKQRARDILRGAEAVLEAKFNFRKQKHITVTLEKGDIPVK